MHCSACVLFNHYVDYYVPLTKLLFLPKSGYSASVSSMTVCTHHGSRSAISRRRRPRDSYGRCMVRPSLAGSHRLGNRSYRTFDGHVTPWNCRCVKVATLYPWLSWFGFGATPANSYWWWQWLVYLQVQQTSLSLLNWLGRYSCSLDFSLFSYVSIYKQTHSQSIITFVLVTIAFN